MGLYPGDGLKLGGNLKNKSGILQYSNKNQLRQQTLYWEPKSRKGSKRELQPSPSFSPKPLSKQLHGICVLVGTVVRNIQHGDKYSSNNTCNYYFRHCLINLYYIIVFNSDIKKLNYKIWHAEL